MSTNVSNFTNSLRAGEKAENEILSLIKRKYPLAYKMLGKFKPYDIIVPELEINGEPHTIEVKLDEKSEYTGNFYFETAICYTEDRDFVPSGITSTEAKWWVHIDKYYYYWLLTETLRWILPQNGRRPITSKDSDDGCHTQGYLVPVGTLHALKLTGMVSITDRLPH